ncbi:MAG: CoA-transferase [Bacillota bacterium]|nr:CoA-transferase [Bacillota bacterium]
MLNFYTKQEAAALIPDGAVVGVNNFLALCQPAAIHEGITDSFLRSGHPRDLTLICTGGFGNWREDTLAEPYVAAGAVRRVIASHYGSMPVTTRRALNNEIEAYCLPLGAISHGIRAGAGGLPGCLSQVGLGIFVDPRIHGAALNQRSKEEFISLLELDGEEYLYYRIPRLDVALIKATSLDANGNLSFENEFITADALSCAQNAKANGGLVIAQVDRVSSLSTRPRNVIVPGFLVDAVVVEEPEDHTTAYSAMNGDFHAPPLHLKYWMDRLNRERGGEQDNSGQRHIIGRRACAELKAGDVVNIGIGIPELVGIYAAKNDILEDLTLTVEAGGVGGLPAAGELFGATIGADMVSDIATQFDFYDGGGLSVCFMGALEVDRYGNVNAHSLPGQFSGIGGFANVTHATKKVVFCLTFRTGGLKASLLDDATVRIDTEGEQAKFRARINSISFSAANALKKGQQVLYVTERCVFELTAAGLKLIEVYPGIDRQRQILDLLEFPVIVDGSAGV